MTVLNWIFLGLAAAGIVPGLWGWLRYGGTRGRQWRNLILPTIGMAMATGSLTPAAAWAGVHFPLEAIGVLLVLGSTAREMRMSGSPAITPFVMVVSVVAMAGTLFIAFPLAEFLGIDTTLGLCVIMTVLLGTIGLLTTKALRSDPTLGTPVPAGQAVLIVFGFTTTLGVMTALFGDQVIGLTVLVMSLCGIGLGTIYLRRARNEHAAS